MKQRSLGEWMGHQCARWARRLGAEESQVQLIQRLAQQLQAAVSQGHTCLPIALDERRELLASPVASALESEAITPLKVDAEGRLYWHRQMCYEIDLAREVVRRSRCFLPPSERATIQNVLRSVLKEPSANNQQHLAIMLGATRFLTLVSGGPGTGKTTLAVSVLEIALRVDPHARVALSAPTGKAAHRLLQAVEKRILDWPEDLRGKVPDTPWTLHRLIGLDPKRTTPKYHRAHPLPLDLLIIDEASMMDLSLAARVFEALPQGCRVLMLGDKDQLSAVESGAVFAELAARPAWSKEGAHHLSAFFGGVWPIADTGLTDTSVILTEQHRFKTHSGLGQVAHAIRDGLVEEAMALLLAPQCTELDIRLEVPLKKTPDRDLIERFRAGYAPYWKALKEHPDLRTGDCLKVFDQFRILCARHIGPWGSAALGGLLDQGFRKQWGDSDSLWYVGRPIMMTRNDPALGVVNGEIGITRRSKQGDLVVEFVTVSGEIRAYAPTRLSHFEVAYAMTIHKSQGSELDEVLVVLGEEGNEGLTRELLYTGVTRAVHRATLVGQEAAVRSAILTPSVRYSGLGARVLELLESPS